MAILFFFFDDNSLYHLTFYVEDLFQYTGKEQKREDYSMINLGFHLRIYNIIVYNPIIIWVNHKKSPYDLVYFAVYALMFYFSNFISFVSLPQ